MYIELINYLVICLYPAFLFSFLFVLFCFGVLVLLLSLDFFHSFVLLSGVILQWTGLVCVQFWSQKASFGGDKEIECLLVCLYTWKSLGSSCFWNAVQDLQWISGMCYPCHFFSFQCLWSLPMYALFDRLDWCIGKMDLEIGLKNLQSLCYIQLRYGCV